MNRRRLALPITLLVAAQLLLPSFGVAHAHDAGAVALDGRAAERPTVHAHGAGLPHDHSFGSTDKSTLSASHGRKAATGHDSQAAAGNESRAAAGNGNKAAAGRDGKAAPAGFRRLGAPAATLRAPSADWICAWGKTVVPPETSMGGTSRGASPVVTPVFRSHQRRPDRFLGPPLQAPPAARPHERLLGTRPLRGPPRGV
jgi:hypothetical protein